MKHSLLGEKMGLPDSDARRAENVRKGRALFFLRRARWPVWLALTCGISLLMPAPCAAKDCPGGLFGTAGQVLEVVPAPGQAQGLAEVVDPDGRRTLVGAGALFCHGDVVRVSASASQVVVHVEGERRTLEAGQTLRTAARSLPAGLQAQALARLSGLRTQDGRLRPVPVVPEPRQIRAAGGAASAPVWPLGTLRALQSLPRQKLTADVPVVLAWRGGAGPYACEAANDWGDTVRALSQPGTVSWCVLPGLPDATRQLRLREQRGPALTWNIQWVDWAQVPQPGDWLGADKAMGSAQQTAWAIWLWRQGPAEWRLQALAMLQQAAGEQWLAAYYRDLILAEQWDDASTSP